MTQDQELSPKIIVRAWLLYNMFCMSRLMVYCPEVDWHCIWRQSVVKHYGHFRHIHGRHSGTLVVKKAK